MSYAAVDKHVALFAVTIYKYVHTSPNDIFLHEIYKKCYEDYFYPWPIYSYPSINNLVYYYTKVLLSFMCNCHHFATDCLHDYIHFTIYHLELHLQYSAAQAISAISPKTCTLKLQLLHQMKRPTKWSSTTPHKFHILHNTQVLSFYCESWYNEVAHLTPWGVLHERPFTPRGNYLVVMIEHFTLV